MRPRILLTILLTALFVILSGCGTTPNCPTCGTTLNGAYAVINVIPVPEHNGTGEPGGPFNSFDISWLTGPPSGGLAGTHNLDYISDRIGVAVQVIDTNQDISVFSIQGSNAVAGAGNGASPCPTIVQPGSTPPANVEVIPPIVDVFGNFSRYGCRTDLSWEGGPTFHLITGFGPNGNFGGFPGAQCCASRANGVNPMSGPDGLEVSADGNTLFVGNGDSSVAVFDLTTMNLGAGTPPTILATIPTGVGADYDGPQGISGCIASWNGEAGSATDCGDDRADEMSFDNVHNVLAVINGDPGFPFITFIDMSGVVARNAADPQKRQHCLPIDTTLAYGPYPPGFDPATYPLQGSGTGVPPSLQLDPSVGGSFNPPSCILGQIYYDGVGGAASGVGPPDRPFRSTRSGATSPAPIRRIPTSSAACPDQRLMRSVPSVTLASELPPAVRLTRFRATMARFLIKAPESICSQTPPFPDSSCGGAISPAGLGGMAWDQNSGHLLLSNENSVANINIGSIDVIDPRLTDTSCGGVSCGPVVVNSIPMPNCMPTGCEPWSRKQLPVGCADHDGKSFPANEYIITYTPGNTVNCQRHRSATAFRSITSAAWTRLGITPPTTSITWRRATCFPSAVMGVIDAKTNQWLVNMPTGSNAHSISVDPVTNHVFVPLQAGTVCSTLASDGCVGVAAEQ